MKKVEAALLTPQKRRRFIRHFLLGDYDTSTLRRTKSTARRDHEVAMYQVLLSNLDAIASYGLPETQEMFLVAANFIASSFISRMFLRFVPADVSPQMYLKTLRADLDKAHTLWDFATGTLSPFPGLAEFEEALRQPHENTQVTQQNLGRLYQIFIEYELLQLQFAYHITIERDTSGTGGHLGSQGWCLRAYLPLDRQFEFGVKYNETSMKIVDRTSSDLCNSDLRTRRSGTFKFSNGEIGVNPVRAADRLVDYLNEL